MAIQLSAGAGDALEISSLLPNPVTSYPLTICMTLQFPDPYLASRAILTMSTSTGGNYIEIGTFTSTTSGKVKPRMEQNGNFTPAVDDAFDTETPVVMIFEYRASNDRRMYLNGTQIGTTATSVEKILDLNGLDELSIGGKYQHTENAFDGIIQDVGIWEGITLTSAERTALNTRYCDTLARRPKFAYRFGVKEDTTIKPYAGGQPLIDGGTDSYTVISDIVAKTALPPGTQVRQWMSPRSGILQSRTLDEDRQYISTRTGASVARLTSQLRATGDAAGGSGQDIPMPGLNGGFYEKGEEAYALPGLTGGFGLDQGAITSIEVALSLAATAGIIPVGVAIAEQSISFATILGLSLAALRLVDGALPLISTMSLTNVTDATAEGSVALASTLAQLLSGEGLAQANLTLDMTTGYTAVTVLQHEVAFALAAATALNTTADAIAEGAVSLDAVLALTTSAEAIAEGAVSLEAILALVNSADVTAERSISLAAILALVNSADATAEGAVSLDAVLALVNSAEAIAEGAVSLEAILALVNSADTIAERSISLDAVLALTTSADATTEGAVSLEAILALINSAIITNERSISLEAILALTTSADATAEAPLSFDAVLALATSADATAEGTLLLETMASLAISAGNLIDVGLILNAVAGYATTADAVGEGALSLASTPGYLAASDAVAEGAMVLAVATALALSADATAEGAVAMAIVAAYIVAGVQTLLAPVHSSTTLGTGDAASHTFSSFVVSGANPVLVVKVSTRGAGVTVTGITWNTTEDLTQENTDINNDSRADLWYLAAPTATTADIVVTFSSGNRYVVAASLYTGADGTTPVRTAASASANGNSAAPSVAITAQLGDMIVDAVGQISNHPNIATAAHTERHNGASIGGGTDNRGASQELTADGTEQTMSWAMDDSDSWAIVTMALRTPFGAIEVDFSLGAIPGISLDAAASREIAMTLAVAAGLTLAAQAFSEAAVVLAAGTGLTFNGLATAEGLVAFNATTGLLLTGEAQVEGSLTLGSSLTISVDGGVVLEDALTFAETSGIGLTSDVSIETALAITLTSGIDFAGQVEAQTNISFAATSFLGLDAGAVAEAGLDLATIQAMQIIAQALAEAGLPLDAITGISIVGEQLIVSIQVSPGRTIMVAIESRVVLVDQELRTITPKAESRTTIVKDE